MSKKKRNKKYTGRDAAMTHTKVTRVSVPDRSPVGKWWHDNGQKMKRRLILIASLIAFYLLISWLLALIF